MPAFERAVASGKPAILHVKIDPDAITPVTTLTKIREAALAKNRPASEAAESAASPASS